MGSLTLDLMEVIILDKESKRKKQDGKDIAFGVAQRNITQKYGEAASQMLQALKGKRFDTNGQEIRHMGRSLKEISKYKINKDYEYSNTKQQAGFSAELVKEARDNKRAIINDDNTRTRTTDGIGKINDQKHDHVKVDENNNVITGTETQMKFNGRFSSPEEIQRSSEAVVKKMIGKDWEKYSESPMDLPSEQATLARNYAKAEAEKIRKSAAEHRNKGDLNKANMLEEKAQKFETAEKNIRDSGVNSKEAMEARINPRRFAGQEVVKDSHKAGLEAAKGASIMALTISSAQNIYAVVIKEKSLEEATRDVVASTGKATLIAYGVGGSGTAIKSLMHVSNNGVMRNIGRTNAPAMIATGMMETGKSIHRYAMGEINEEELLEELGEKGTGMVAASYGSAVGTLVLPGVGTVIGGMIGYTISSIFYKESLEALQNERISSERRRVIEKINEEAIKEMKAYRIALNEQRLKEEQLLEDFFFSTFEEIDHSILNNNMENFFNSINRLGNAFEMDMLFKDFEEFDDFMKDDESTLLL